MPKKQKPTGFAARLRALREAAGLSQKELAERAGFHEFSVAKWEMAIREPTWSAVLALARALGKRPNDFEPEEAAPKRRGGNK